MKTGLILNAALVSLAIYLTGCASTPNTKSEMTKDQILQQEDVKKNTPVVYAANIEQVRQAGIRALTFVGAKLEKQESYFLTGKRPSKMGLFVGSGGETIKIFLYPKSETETQVWVDTDLSFVGIVGQQSWDKQVRAEMDSILTQRTEAK